MRATHSKTSGAEDTADGSLIQPSDWNADHELEGFVADDDARLGDAREPTAHNHDYEAFPVGAVFLSVVSTNPATLLGYGTWSAFGAGRMLVGLDSGQTEFDTVEETGGAKTVTLTEAQIPSHTHTQNSHNHTQDAHTHVQNAHVHDEFNNSATTGGSVGWGAQDTSTNTASLTGYDTGSTTAVNQNATATNQATTATNQNTGGGTSHPNLPPYIVVYMWKRTA
jgi:microcystin-dependent protein